MALLLKQGKTAFICSMSRRCSLLLIAAGGKLSVIDQLVKSGCQFIIATHSPILLAYPNAKILVCDATGITETATNTLNTTRSPAIF